MFGSFRVRVILSVEILTILFCDLSQFPTESLGSAFDIRVVHLVISGLPRKLPAPAFWRNAALANYASEADEKPQTVCPESSQAQNRLTRQFRKVCLLAFLPREEGSADSLRTRSPNIRRVPAAQIEVRRALHQIQIRRTPKLLCATDRQ